MEFSSGGWPTWQGQFGPFGQELLQQPTANQDKFAGLKRDNVTGLDHATFRNYSSTTGRWLSSDPYDRSMNLADTQSLNRYTYSNNTPTIFNDPLGLQSGANGDGSPSSPQRDFLCKLGTQLGSDLSKVHNFLIIPRRARQTRLGHQIGLYTDKLTMELA